MSPAEKLKQIADLIDAYTGRDALSDFAELNVCLALVRCIQKVIDNE